MPPLDAEKVFRFINSPKRVSNEQQDREQWQQAAIWVWQIKHDYTLFHRFFKQWKDSKKEIYLYLNRYVHKNYPPSVNCRLSINEQKLRLERMPENIEDCVRKRNDHEQLPESMRTVYDEAMKYRDKVLQLREQLAQQVISDDSPDKTKLQVERAATIRKLLTAYRNMRKKFELYDSVNILHHVTINDHYYQGFRAKNVDDLEEYKKERRKDFQEIADFAAKKGIDIEGAKQKTEIPNAKRKMADLFNPPPEWKKSLKEWQMQCIYQYEGEKKKNTQQKFFK